MRIMLMGPMSCSVQTGISPNLAGSFTLVCNPNPRRVSSFLPRNRSRIRIRSRSISRVLLIITKRHFSKNRIFHSQAQPPLLSAERRWNLSVYATTSLDLPLLPFGVNDVLVPSESKTLHLYEARYLALLDESLFRKNKLFVHFVLDPVAVSDSSREISFAARHACLVFIENVERLQVGALVTIRGIGRVKIIELLQVDPYLRGRILSVRDNIVQDECSLSSKVMDVKNVLHNLNSLEIKLKAPKEVLLQTQILNSLNWAVKGIYVDIDQNFVPSLAERVSFAAFQPISGSTKSELQSLQLKKLKAMDMKNTLERLNKSLKLIKENISTVAAKLAIQSIEI
ncbi:uncharacterized protein LOC103498728 isoform X2 [Cucumis melo]|uniref:Uncharacterized protein LOC103498728 isoform X2 n=1 Tax=Cucumis melo TaxID=3656 RepID=A0A1S3CAR7_CUCME|nr:uncharacterized protein LOC103498728 isoform X2 [Cucumis melo]